MNFLCYAAISLHKIFFFQSVFVSSLLHHFLFINRTVIINAIKSEIGAPLIPVPAEIKNSTKKAGVFAPAFPITYYYSSISILMLVITGISNGLFQDSGPCVGRSAIRSSTSNPDTSCPKAA